MRQLGPIFELAGIEVLGPATGARAGECSARVQVQYIYSRET